MNVLQTLEEELKWVTLHHVSSGTGTLAQLPHEGLVNYSSLLLKSAFFFPSKWVINHQKNLPRALGEGRSHFPAHIQRTRSSAMKPSASCQGPMSKQLSPLGISKHCVRDEHPSPFQSIACLHTGLAPRAAGEYIHGWCPPVVVLAPSPSRTREAPWIAFLADHLWGVWGAQASSAGDAG